MVRGAESKSAGLRAFMLAILSLHLPYLPPRDTGGADLEVGACRRVLVGGITDITELRQHSINQGGSLATGLEPRFAILAHVFGVLLVGLATVVALRAASRLVLPDEVATARDAVHVDVGRGMVAEMGERPADGAVGAPHDMGCVVIIANDSRLRAACLFHGDNSWWLLATFACGFAVGLLFLLLTRHRNSLEPSWPTVYSSDRSFVSIRGGSRNLPGTNQASGLAVRIG